MFFDKINVKRNFVKTLREKKVDGRLVVGGSRRCERAGDTPYRELV